MREAPSTDLADWLLRVGINATVFARILAARGCPMTKGTLSDIISKKRRCSLEKALILNEVTGVPINCLIEWPPRMDGAGEAHSEPGRDIRTIQATP